MSDHAPERDRIVEGVFPAEAPQHPAAPTLIQKFEPWHKPRKQWVRKFQWVKEIGKLMGDLSFKDDRPLKYLCLAADDLLDVRVIGELCAREKHPLRYLGFSLSDPKADGTQLNISINELSKQEAISKNSRVVGSRFQDVANTKAIAFASIEEAGPFDVINIDLCDSIASKINNPKRVEPTYYDGIHKLLEFQMQQRSEPWLLFLTTRTTPGDVFEEDARRLWGAIQANISADSDFAQRFEKFLDHKIESITRAPGRVFDLSKLKFLRFFGIGICKWLLRNAMGATPPWKMESTNTAFYRIGGEVEPEMLSISLKFSAIREPLADKADLSRPPFGGASTPTPPNPSETELARAMVEVHSKAVDIDGLLEGDAKLKEALLIQSQQLLESSRYDCSGYRAWATAS